MKEFQVTITLRMAVEATDQANACDAAQLLMKVALMDSGCDAEFEIVDAKPVVVGDSWWKVNMFRTRNTSNRILVHARLPKVHKLSHQSVLEL